MRPLASLLPGLVLTALLTLLATLAARIDLLQAAGASPLTLALLLGALLGNLRPQAAQGSRQAGLRFSQKVLLRTGVALYGFNLSLQQIAAVGSSGLWIDALIVVSTLGLGCYIGRRWLGMEQGAALLVAAGSAICGAAAIVATVSSLRLDEEARTRHTATAIATVVLFGTAAMLLYPLLFSWLGSDAGHFGGYVGSTVHEVAQVVAIGNALGPEAAQHAVIMKMIRVLMLVPFLLALGFWQSRRQDGADGQKTAGHSLVRSAVHAVCRRQLGGRPAAAPARPVAPDRHCLPELRHGRLRHGNHRQPDASRRPQAAAARRPAVRTPDRHWRLAESGAMKYRTCRFVRRLHLR